MSLAGLPRPTTSLAARSFSAGPPPLFCPCGPGQPLSQTSKLQSFSLNLHSPGRPPTAPCRIQLVYLLPLIDVTHQLYDDELLVMPPQPMHTYHTHDN